MFRRTGILTVVAWLLVVAPASAANWTVNTLADGDDATINGTCETATDNGVCTLRAALAEANAALNEQAIGFSVSGTHTLNGTQLIAQGGSGTGLTITGHPSGTTIDANASSRVMAVAVSTVTLIDLRIQNGSLTENDGAGIHSSADTLNLNRVTVTGNKVSTTGGNGGAGILTFDADSALNLTDSTVSDNTVTGPSGVGGGIRAFGPVAVDSTTISGNKASQGDTGAGGGLFLGLGSHTITNSTISGNQSGTGGAGGIRKTGGSGSTVTILNSTIAGNSTTGAGGGISSTDSWTASNTILAQNTSPTLGFANCEGGPTLPTPLNNIDSDTSCDLGTTNGNQENVSPTALALGPLANNGGLTQTRALFPGSVAIDAGDSPTCASIRVNNVDQRGFTRPAACDVGAFERQPVDVLPPDVLAPNTLISKGPKKRTPKAKAKFTFSSTEAGSRFLCKLDKKAFAACTSPKTYKVKRGKHTVLIQAIDAAGNADGSPAVRKWRRV